MKYFTLYELCKSDTAKKQNIDNFPTWEVVDNLKRIVEEILDPLREWYEKPIKINSGYRSQKLNKAVGGVNNSFHLNGCGVDIDTNNTTENKKLFEYIKNNLPFTELGWEGNGSWIHVGYNGNNNKEIFSA